MSATTFNNAPFGLDPEEARAHLATKKSALNWALEMLGSDDGEPVAYLREVDAGTDVACWVVCAKGDPGAEPVYLVP